MTDREFIAIYKRWLNEVCYCHEDKKGNYPCDYGVKCNYCETVSPAWEEYLERERNK